MCSEKLKEGISERHPAVRNSFRIWKNTRAQQEWGTLAFEYLFFSNILLLHHVALFFLVETSEVVRAGSARLSRVVGVDSAPLGPLRLHDLAVVIHPIWPF